MAAEPVTSAPDEPLEDVIRRMTTRRVGAVLVVADGRVEGIFTERDFLRVAAEAPHGWRQRSVADWMTRDPRTIAPDAGWEEAVSLMERLHVRHLPVVDGGRAVSVVSARELIAHRTQHLDRLVQERTGKLEQLTALLLERDRQSQRNLRVAGRLLNSLLVPGSPPEWPELAWAIHFSPLDSLGGDYFDFARPDDRNLTVLVADASGHNIAAAMVAIMARFAFSEAVRADYRPAPVLAAMNRRLQGLADERYVTAFCGLFDRHARTLTYANAGHPHPLLCRAPTGDCRPLDATGFMLGIVPDAAYDEQSVTLAPGDRICLCTDGLIDAQDEAGTPFEMEGLERAVRESAQFPAEEMLRHVLATLATHRGERPVGDDVTALIAEVR